MPTPISQSSSGKRYLTGIDWVINTLDSMTKIKTGHGNASQIILALQKTPDIARLESLLKKTFTAFPFLNGRVRRDWNLCPYWRPGRPGQEESLPLTVQNLPNGDFHEAFALLEKDLQEPFMSPSEHLRFKIVNYSENHSLLGMNFDHRLLDAYGAELFLDMLAHENIPTENTPEIQPDLTEPAHLNQWAQRFSSGRNIHRFQRRLSQDGLAALPIGNESSFRKTKIELITFPEEQSGNIYQTATGEAGPLIIMPALLARVLQALHQIFQKRGLTKGHYVAPVSINQRRPEKMRRKLFFNHLSFVFFQVPASEVAKNKDLTSLLRNQLYEQIKEGVPEDIYHASMLTRIAPLKLMRQFAKIPMDGKVATTYFSCFKESGFKSKSFLNAKVENLIHTPHVPVPPGLGVFLNFFDNRLNLVLSYLENILAEDEVKQLKNDLKRKLNKMSVR